MKVALLTLCVVASALALAAPRDLSGYTYDQWLADGLGQRFPGTRSAFEANLAKIIAHNSDPTRTWNMDVNEFAALSGKEFKHYYSGYRSGMRGLFGGAEAKIELQPLEALPTSVDWREKNVVTDVKNQGGCGGCWAFSAAETFESFVAIKTGKLLHLSEQQILSCTPNPNHCGGSGGCDGATQELAFNYTATNAQGGITSEQNWPFTGRTGTCTTSRIKPVAKNTGFVTLKKNDYPTMMNAIANLGPVSISAAAEPWQFYSGGVFSSGCGTDVDHAIQMVGYGTEGSQDYWLVRNSWGPGWGESGYIRVARYGASPKGEPCAEDHRPDDGDGCKNGPKEIEVCGLCGILSDSSYPTGATTV